MPGQKREELLTKMERDRLNSRLVMKDKKARAANDIRVRKKLSAWLKNIPDVLLILGKIPNDQIREELSDDDIYKLFILIEASMNIGKFSPIVGRIEDERWIGYNGTAEDLDIWRSWNTWNHIERMYDLCGRGNPVEEFNVLDMMDADEKFHDYITEEQRRGVRRIRRVVETNIDKVLGEEGDEAKVFSLRYATYLATRKSRGLTVALCSRSVVMTP